MALWVARAVPSHGNNPKLLQPNMLTQYQHRLKRACCPPSGTTHWYNSQGSLYRLGTLVAKGYTRCSSRQNGIVINLYPLRSFENLFERHRHDVWGLQRDHVVPFLFGNGAHGRSAESHREQPVVTCRLSSAFDLAEDECARFLLGELLDFIGEPLRDSSNSDRLAWHRLSSDGRPFAARKRAYRDDDEGEVPPRPAPRRDLFAHLVDVVRNFRNQNDVRGAGESGVQRDEAGVATHHLQHDHAVVTLRRRVKLVDGFQRGVDRGVESESRDGASHVVVDGLRDTDDFDASLAQLVRDAHRSVAAHGDHRIDAEFASVFDQLSRAVLFDEGSVGLENGITEGIAAVSGPENGSTEVRYAAYCRRRHGNHFFFAEESSVAFLDSKYFPASIHSREHRSADHCVEARRVTTSGGQRYAHDFSVSVRVVR